MAKTTADNSQQAATPIPPTSPGVGDGELAPPERPVLDAGMIEGAPPPPYAPPVQITRTEVDPEPERFGRRVVLGQTVYVTDSQTNTVHPAIVTHVNDDVQSIIATVFKTNECAIGVGFLAARGGLAAPGCWHEPFAD